MPPQYEQGCHNLRLYLRHATLPEMNCTRFCPHLNNPEVYNSTTNLFQLSPKPESTRKLRQVLYLLPEVINRKINNCKLFPLDFSFLLGWNSVSSKSCSKSLTGRSLEHTTPLMIDQRALSYQHHPSTSPILLQKAYMTSPPCRIG